MRKTIVFCGGGSVGHITPSLAVADALRKRIHNLSAVFIATARPDERAALAAAGVDTAYIYAGKFPRGVSARLITFPFLFIVSLVQSFRHLRCLGPSVVFSKGGYVSAPVCLAAWVLGIPIVLHASDSVPSLSDRLVGRLAQRICTGFPFDHFPASLHPRSTVTGNPVRPIILAGSKDAGQRITGFSGRRPVLLVMGGSQGSITINHAIDVQFDALLELADIIHITGVGKAITRTHARYWSNSFVTDDLPHLYALADIVITRAGAGTLSELAVLKKPAIVIPLAGVAHDHQIKNAALLAKQHAAIVLDESDLARLTSVVQSLLIDPDHRKRLGIALSHALPTGAAERTAEVVLDVLRKNCV